MGPKKKQSSDDKLIVEQLGKTKISDDPIKPRFPLKPVRTTNPPGNPVQLITNLVYLSIKENKKIYKYTVEIEIQEEKIQLSGDSEKRPRKLPNTLRTKAIQKAVGKLTNNDGLSLDYNFVYDANGSIIYTLFDMFTLVKQASEQTVVVTVSDDDIVQGKLVKVDKKFSVRIMKTNFQLDFVTLAKSCRVSKETFDIVKFNEDIKAMNVLLHSDIIKIPSNVVTKYAVFPFIKQKQFDISPGVLFNKGYSMSTRPTESGLTLNVANTGKAFYKGIFLLDMLKDRLRVQNFSSKLNFNQIDALKKEIMTKQIEAIHKNYGTKGEPRYRKYRVTGVTTKTCSEEKFTLVDKKTKDSSEISIFDYLKKEYNYNLKYPNLPCIESSGRKIPIEVCKLVEKQGVNRKMTPDETSEVIRRMAVKPEEYFQAVRENLKDIKSSMESAANFGLDVSLDLIRVTGREIPPFSLVGGKNRVIIPRDGQFNIKGIQFYRPVTVKKWVIVFFADRRILQDSQRMGVEKRLNAMDFALKYKKEGEMNGMTFEKPEIELVEIEVDDFKLRANLKQKFSEWNKLKVQHAIIILADKCQDWLYPFIQYLEVSNTWPGKEYATRTSCMLYSNYTKKIINDRFGGQMFISNLLLKHNTKLGGLNYILADQKGPYNSFLEEGYIFLSVDVCHPAPGDKLIQSVAAVVGMWDLTNQNLSYCTRMRVQKKTNENHSTIEEVGEVGLMMEEILQEYKRKKNKLPTKIVIMRDGVSEGQFRMVLESELVRIKSHLSNLYKRVMGPNQKLAPITCIVVQKRHKVRFMRVEPYRNNKGILDYNIQPGTVVDTTITHPSDTEFYINPHKALQGTSRPYRAYLITNELSLNMDTLEFLMHSMSYLFGFRCNKSISIPTPVALADLSAERGKHIVLSWQNDIKHNAKKQDELLKTLNGFLSNLGDNNYKNTLFYI